MSSINLDQIFSIGSVQKYLTRGKLSLQDFQEFILCLVHSDDYSIATNKHLLEIIPKVQDLITEVNYIHNLPLVEEIIETQKK